MINSNWNFFWNKENAAFDQLMAITTNIFYKNMSNQFPINPTDIVLDYGCGSGILINHLSGISKKVVGVDSSAWYVEKCKKTYENTNNVVIYKVSGIPDLEYILKKENANKVVVLSVIQYFTSLDELHSFLEILRKSVLGSKYKINVLIADIIPVKHSIITDLFEIIFDALKNNYFLTLIKFIIKYTKENIANYTADRLHVDYQYFSDYAKKHNMDIRKIERMTNHKSRYSIEITFTSQFF